MIDAERLKNEIQKINNNYHYNNVNKILILADIENHIDSYSNKIIIDETDLASIFNIEVKTVSRNIQTVNNLNQLISEYSLPAKSIEFANWTDLSFNDYDIIICTDDNEKEFFDYLQDLFSETFLTNTQIMPVFVDSLKTESDFNFQYFENLPKLFIKKYFNPEAKRNINIKLRSDTLQKRLIKHRNENLKKFELIFDKIGTVNKQIELKNIKSLLIIDDFDQFFIGDICNYINYLRKLVSVFPNVKLLINCRNEIRFLQFKQLIKNIEILDNNFYNYQWDQIEFLKFDLIICCRKKEIDFLEYIQNNYNHLLLNNQIPFVACSIHDKAFFYGNYCCLENIELLLKRHDVVIDNVMGYEKEIIVSNDDLQQGQKWLFEHNVNMQDEIVILLNISFRTEKMLTEGTYFDLIKWVIINNKSKVLIFDPFDTGMESEIQQKFNSKISQNIIIAKSLNLRETINIIACDQIKSIIGPCTGLMHIANNVYTYLLNLKKKTEIELPLIFVYIGYQFEGYNPWFWWNDSLAHCMVIQKGNILKSLADCPIETEWFDKNLISTKKINSEMFIHYLSGN